MYFMSNAPAIDFVSKLMKKNYILHERSFSHICLLPYNGKETGIRIKSGKINLIVTKLNEVLELLRY